MREVETDINLDGFAHSLKISNANGEVRLRAVSLQPAAGSQGELTGLMLVRAYFELALKVFGPNPLGWHVVALGLHVANAAWVFVLARKLGAQRHAAWIACGLFAASPLAFTVVYWVACIQELGSGFFLLASVYCALFAPRARWLSVALFAVNLGMMAITWPKFHAALSQLTDFSAFTPAHAVLFWLAGFDIIYAFMDVKVDRAEGLRSIPADYGQPAGLWAGLNLSTFPP